MTLTIDPIDPIDPGDYEVYALFRDDIKEEVPSGKGEGAAVGAGLAASENFMACASDLRGWRNGCTRLGSYG